ncbi:hypothetical protein C8R44DRAFT_893612 [Mycena epipterygia]|nr:hypothetical protein C8R44DRAFT_893612 [Mycena epipterygia]
MSLILVANLAAATQMQFLLLIYAPPSPEVPLAEIDSFRKIHWSHSMVCGARADLAGEWLHKAIDIMFWLWSHPFVHAPQVIKWRQWLLRKLYNMFDPAHWPKKSHWPEKNPPTPRLPPLTVNLVLFLAYSSSSIRSLHQTYLSRSPTSARLRYNNIVVHPRVHV